MGKILKMRERVYPLLVQSSVVEVLKEKGGYEIATGRQGVHCNVRHKAQPLEMSLTRSPASATVVAISPSTKAAFSAFCSLFQGS